MPSRFHAHLKSASEDPVPAGSGAARGAWTGPPDVLFERCAGVGAVDVRHMSAHFEALEAAVCEAASLAPPWLAARCGRALLWCLRFELLAAATLGLGTGSLGLGAAASLGLAEAAIGAAALLSLSAAEPSRRRGGTGRAAASALATSDWF